MIINSLFAPNNIRDIGGNYLSASIKEGLLLRGKDLAKLNEEEIKLFINIYHIKTVIDLRSDLERKEASPYSNLFSYLYLPVYKEYLPGISHEEGEKINEQNVHLYVPEMDVLYYQMLHDEPLINLGIIIKYILNNVSDENPIYFHCSEGKDRTGIISAILLSILGVDRKEIVEEYLYTNVVSLPKAKEIATCVRSMTGDNESADKIERIFIAKEEYINVLFKVIDEEYHSLDNFLYNGLKVEEKEAERFKKIMLDF